MYMTTSLLSPCLPMFIIMLNAKFVNGLQPQDSQDPFEIPLYGKDIFDTICDSCAVTCDISGETSSIN